MLFSGSSGSTTFLAADEMVSYVARVELLPVNVGPQDTILSPQEAVSHYHGTLAEHDTYLSRTYCIFKAPCDQTWILSVEFRLTHWPACLPFPRLPPNSTHFYAKNVVLQYACSAESGAADKRVCTPLGEAISTVQYSKFLSAQC